MKKCIIIVLFIALVCGCSGSGSDSESYQQGQAMADKVYGSVAPEKMLEQMESIMGEVESKLEGAEDQRDWWNGFCDKGKEIWIDRVDQINDSFGQDILSAGDIKDMFNDMKSSFRE